MAYPNLYSDESVIVNAQNIKVKSVSFEAVLTTRRLILVDSKKHIIAPQEILLATIRDIEVGENAIRDPTITLSIITATGATRQMILTFSKISGGERKRECDEWVKILKSTIASAVQHAIVPDTPPRPDPYAADTAAAPAASPRVEAAPVPPAPAPKKKIEIARPGPMKKIVETAPSIPKPVETTSLPTGGSFCNRCGSRVPPDSAFCNKCGTPVVTEADLEARLAGTAPAPAPAVPQVHVPTPPVYGGPNEKKERPIEDVIHSIEPLIEDSVPRTIPAPIVPRHYPQPFPEPQPAEQPAEQPPAPAAPATAPGAVPEAAPADQPGPAVSEVKWPVLGGAALPPQEPAAAAGSPASPAPAAPAPAVPVPPVPPAPAPARSKKFLVAGIVAIVIIAIIAAVFVFVSPLSGGGTVATPTPTPTPATTPLVTTVATTATATPAVTVPAKTTPAAAATTAPASASSAGQLAVPSRGVFVHVIYAGEYKGSVGMPGSELDVTGSGEKIFTIPTVEGIVVASIQKVDGSSDKLTVEVYKNGDLVISKSTVTPKGIVEVQANLKPSTTVPTTVATTATVRTTNTTASGNATANAAANATETATVP